MNAVALRMLTGDPAKYLGLIFGIAFASMLMSQQVSIFVGLMLRTASQILDVREADVWVMDPRVQYVDEIEPMTDTQLYRVRGVSGVDWAEPYYKGLTVARAKDGVLQQVILQGLSDATLTGAPTKMILGFASSAPAADARAIVAPAKSSPRAACNNRRDTPAEPNSSMFSPLLFEASPEAGQAPISERGQPSTSRDAITANAGADRPISFLLFGFPCRGAGVTFDPY